MGTNKLIEEVERYISEHKEWVYRGYSPSEYTLILSKRVKILVVALESAKKDLELLGNADLTLYRIREALEEAEKIKK